MFDLKENSRIYKLLRKIAGDSVDIVPRSTLEKCLYDIAERVNGENNGND